MINCDGLTLVYPDGTVGIKDVNLNIDKGDLVYIIGPSGSGKTSFFKLIMGIEYPSRGRMTVLGQDMAKGNDRGVRKIRQEIGPVFQDFKLIRGRTALENTILGMRFLDFSNSEIKIKGEAALERVGLKDKMQTNIENLSWGQAQRVAIARAIVRKPKLLIADEPTGNLDIENALNILRLLNSLKEQDTTVIITTHATHLIEDLDHGRILHVDNGSIDFMDLEGAYI